ncbi:DUF6318 family protein [Aeromicrobium sp. CF3.5]|uniref:DUF6318 family protein n=1 Tax=Aeromicrobium sp. CF3.5 TaxID=3373078 RepID=UPI003EE5A1A6
MKIGGFFIAVALVLAGCSSDPQPRDPTTSATPTSTATPPPMPPQASEDTPEGAAAFVTHWVDNLNFAARTGDVEGLTAVSSTNCGGCSSYADQLAADVDGGRPTEKFWTLKTVRVGTSREPLTAEVTAAVLEGSGSRNYRFNFQLTSGAPFKVEDISILED